MGVGENYTQLLWFIPISSKDCLGFNYAFLRNRNERWGFPMFGRVGQTDIWRWKDTIVYSNMASIDLKALQSLWKTRTQQLEVLKFRLLSKTSQSEVPKIISQTLMPGPKPKASPEQLALQEKLIAACKQGDAKAVGALLQQGAKQDMANTKGVQPLGAAVWGMCPDVVNALLKQADGVTPMTWEECRQHNSKYYGQVFIVPNFLKSQSWWDFYGLVSIIDQNPFIRAYHLKKADEQWHNNYTADWETYKKIVYFMGLSHTISSPNAKKEMPEKARELGLTSNDHAQLMKKYDSTSLCVNRHRNGANPSAV